MSVTVGHKLPTIKPDDVVRTPSGRTCVCLAINRDGSRVVRDLITGEFFDILPKLLYLVRAAIPKPWKERRL